MAIEANGVYQTQAATCLQISRPATEIKIGHIGFSLV